MSADVVERAKALGHTKAELRTTRRGLYKVTCNCGYESASRQTEALAFEALAHHLAKAVGARLQTGESLPRAVGARL